MSGASPYYDELETRAPDERERALFAELRRQIAHARAKALYFARRFADVDPAAVTDRAALARLPVTRKEELIAAQAEAPPLGGFAAIPPGDAARLFASPGPAYELETGRADYWRSARAVYAAGFRRGEVALNCFSYHLSPGGWIMDAGLRALGCAVIPGGTGNSETQAQVIAQLRPVGYSGTPDFLKVLLDKGAELGLDCSSIAKAIVSGGALFPATRQEYLDRGIACLQCYATADFGLIAYESAPDEGLIVEESLIVEIVRPGTDDPVPEGEVGEVVVTLLGPEYPLIRVSTGDLSAVLPGASACGRTNTRLKGWMGRADQATKVKGMFVRPRQVAEVLKRHPEIARARLVVGREGETDVMALHCEAAGGGNSEALERAIAETLQSVSKLKGAVVLCAPGTLANDGKVIEDTRDYA